MESQQQLQIPSKNKKKKSKKTPADLSRFDGIKLKSLFPPPKEKEDAEGHNFWKDQPVPHYAETIENPNTGYLTESLEGVRTIPFDLPEGLEWVTYDLNADGDMNEVYEFLRKYYSNNFGTFRFDYSREMLKWCMCPPGYSKTLHIGIRESESTVSVNSDVGTDNASISINRGQLIGFISGAPCGVKVYGKSVKMVEINFLCVHPERRSLKLSPLLIEEVARRVRFLGIWQAIYTASLLLPHAIAVVQYYHRPLNLKKLLDTGFTERHPKLTLAGMLKHYSIPSPMETLRPLTKKDIPGACAMLNKYLSAYHVAQEFTEAEFEHFFMPRADVVYSYVNIVNGVITDFISFYSITFTVHGNPRHKSLKCAYAFYNASADMCKLMESAISLAAKEGFDVFNCLNIMDNMQFIEKLKFTPGNGKLRYYLYNWNCAPTRPEGIGFTIR